MGELECGISCKKDDFACSLDNDASRYSGNIINGVNSDVGEWPWQTHLRYSNGQGFCGGSIINKDYILTAAHCICDGTRVKPDRIFAAVGWHKAYGGASEIDQKMSRYGQDFIPIKRKIKHQNYDNYYNNDIALLKLSRSIKYPTSAKTLVRPVCLPTTEYDNNINYANSASIHSATLCSITGYGTTLGTEKPGSNKWLLMEADIPVITNRYCAQRMGSGWQNQGIPDKMLCADNPNDNVDTCQGDSGGPLVCDAQSRNQWDSQNKRQYALMGLTSWGYGCGESTPGVYTKVVKYTNWIQDNVRRYGGES